VEVVDEVEHVVGGVRALGIHVLAASIPGGVAHVGSVCVGMEGVALHVVVHDSKQTLNCPATEEAPHKPSLPRVRPAAFFVGSESS